MKNTGKPTIKRDLSFSWTNAIWRSRPIAGTKLLRVEIRIADGECYDPDPDPIFLVIPDPAGHQNKTKEKSDEFYVFIKVL
jgi:hypothetical protein